MRSQWIFLLGYVILMGAVVAGLWKLRVLDQIGTTWTVILVVGMIGVGIMLAVARGGKEIKIDRG